MSDRLSQLVKTLSLESEEMQDVPMEQEGLDVPEEQAEFEQAEHENLDEVRESETLSDQLDTLSGQVEEAPEGAALEHYHWMMSTLLANARMPTTKSVALENFTNSDSGKTLLSRSIKKYNGNLKRVIALALEAYVDGFAPALSNRVDKYVELNDKVSNTMSDLPAPTVKTATVNSVGFWKLIHRDGKLIKSSEELKQESVRITSFFELGTEVIETLTADLKSAKDDEVVDFTKVKLANKSEKMLYNRKMNIGSGGLQITEGSVSEPSKTLSITDVAWIALWGFLVPGMGLLLAAIFKKRTGEPKAVNRGRDDMVNVLEAILEVKATVLNADAAVQAFSKELASASAINASNAKKAAAPAIEVISGMTSHVTDVTRGLNSLVTSF